MHIAFFTPLSPIQSALADIGEGLALAMDSLTGVTIDLFIDDTYRPDNAIILDQLQIFPYQEYPARSREYDVTLYSMGDHGSHHGYMLDFIHRYPGVVILHDLTLHRCIIQNTLLAGRVSDYLEEINYAYGIEDLSIVSRLEAGLDNQVLLEYPLFERVVDSSLGVIVQNEYARQQIKTKRPSARVRTIPYPFFVPPGFPDQEQTKFRAQRRAAMNLEEHFVVGSFGIFVPNKHLEACLSAFAHVAREQPQTTYLLGGAAAPEYDLEGEIRKMGLANKVVITGWLSLPEFVRQMFALDVGIHLRYPHIGGTPYTPVRLMGLGISTIISDIEPLAEFPEGACAKIRPDDYEEATLTVILQHLARHDDFRQQMAENGRQYIERRHGLNDVAQQVVDFLIGD